MKLFRIKDVPNLRKTNENLKQKWSKLWPLNGKRFGQEFSGEQCTADITYWRVKRNSFKIKCKHHHGNTAMFEDLPGK